MENLVNRAYEERAHLIALLAGFCPSGLKLANSPDDGWAQVFIDLPTGQVTWYIPPDDLHLFKHVPVIEKSVWDGHNVEEKFKRVDAASKIYAERKRRITEEM